MLDYVSACSIQIHVILLTFKMFCLIQSIFHWMLPIVKGHYFCMSCRLKILRLSRFNERNNQGS